MRKVCAPSGVKNGTLYYLQRGSLSLPLSILPGRKDVEIMTCPICHSATFETSEIILTASIDGPSEYSEYDICLICFWSNKPIAEEDEIPF